MQSLFQKHPKHRSITLHSPMPIFDLMPQISYGEPHASWKCLLCLPFCWRGGSRRHVGNHGIIHVSEEPRRAEIQKQRWHIMVSNWANSTAIGGGGGGMHDDHHHGWYSVTILWGITSGHWGITSGLQASSCPCGLWFCYFTIITTSAFLCWLQQLNEIPVLAAIFPFNFGYGLIGSDQKIKFQMSAFPPQKTKD